jgi:predicted nucleic acid-binding protein
MTTSSTSSRSPAGRCAIEANSIPDPDDVPVLAAALAFHAACVVTGDKALLDPGSVAGMAITAPRKAFETLLGVARGT